MRSSRVAPSTERAQTGDRIVITWLSRVLLLVAAADSVFIIAMFLIDVGGVDGAWVGVLLYNLLTPAVLVALVLGTAGWWPRGMPVTAVASVLLSAVLVATMLDTGSSSTGSLILLFLPIYSCLLVLAFAALGLLVHWLSGRRISSDPQFGR